MLLQALLLSYFTRQVGYLDIFEIHAVTWYIVRSFSAYFILLQIRFRQGNYYYLLVKKAAISVIVFP